MVPAPDITNAGLKVTVEVMDRMAGWLHPSQLSISRPALTSTPRQVRKSREGALQHGTNPVGDLEAPLASPGANPTKTADLQQMSLT